MISPNRCQPKLQQSRWFMVVGGVLMVIGGVMTVVFTIRSKPPE